MLLDEILNQSGYFKYVCPLTTYYLVAMSVSAIIFTLKLKCKELKKLILDFSLVMGLILFIFYFATAYIAYNEYFKDINQLGGLSPGQKDGIFSTFRIFFVTRTAWLVSLYIMTVFIRGRNLIHTIPVRHLS